MFAMLRGPWPRVTAAGVDVGALEASARSGGVSRQDVESAIETLVADAVAAQVGAGLELVTDGHVRWPDPVAAAIAAFRGNDAGRGLFARAWTATASLTDATVAQAIPGPVTLALREVGEWGDVSVVNGQALAHAEVLADEIAALEAAGCGVVIVEEPASVAVAGSDRARDGWIRAHRRMLRDVHDVHLMLAITGGSAHRLGGAAVFGLPYASLLVDLIGGADNWYLVREAPGERGVVCAVLAAAPGTPLGDQSPQMVWAAQYAASMNGRGMTRVGLANASSLGALTPAEARAALDALAQAARFAVMPPAEAVAAGFDERALRVMPKTAGRKR